MSNKNRFYSFITLLVILTVFLPVQSFGNYSQNYFVVTAYYSPLPDQDYYLTGDYKDEIRLNGRGIAGASGKKVFSGMFAAPKKYEFGTKIFLKGIGSGVVEDRGGAIVPAGKRGYNHDRIDIWVGYGDAGLRRALYWGKRKVSGSIISGGSDITFDYKNIPSPLWVTSGLNKIPDIFSLNIGLNTTPRHILSLQKFLKKLGLYKGKLNSKYNNELMNIIFEFQMRNNIIKGEDSLDAGYWGNKTRNLFLKKYLNGDFEKVDKTISIGSDDVIKRNEYKILFNGPLNTKAKVLLFQELLVELDLYKGDVNGVYGDIEKIILDFQLNNNVITSKNSLGAGIFGPKTRAKFKKKYIEYKNNELRKKDLEGKFKELDLMAEKEAIEKINIIGTPKFGDISSSVRKLQNTLKLLGFFNYKDTAIFGQITKKSIIKYQIDNKLITNSLDLGAGIFGPKTKQSLKQSLKNHLLTNEVKKQKLDKKLLLEIGVWSL